MKVINLFAMVLVSSFLVGCSSTKTPSQAKQTPTSERIEIRAYDISDLVLQNGVYTTEKTEQYRNEIATIVKESIGIAEQWNTGGIHEIKFFQGDMVVTAYPVDHTHVQDLLDYLRNISRTALAN